MIITTLRESSSLPATVSGTPEELQQGERVSEAFVKLNLHYSEMSNSKIIDAVVAIFTTQKRHFYRLISDENAITLDRVKFSQIKQDDKTQIFTEITAPNKLSNISLDFLPDKKVTVTMISR